MAQISNTECVHLNDALVWIAFQIYPSDQFEPNDKGTLTWLDMIDFDKWLSIGNMGNPLVYTPEICDKYKLPENIELKYANEYKEEPSNPDLIGMLLKQKNVSRAEKKKLKTQLPEAIEFYTKKTIFDKACSELFEDAQHKLYTAISSGEVRLYGVKFKIKNDVCYTENKVSPIPNKALLYNSFDFDYLELTLRDTGDQYGFLMINLKDLLTKFKPNDITSVKALNVGGKYLLSQDARFAYSGRNAALTPQQLVLLGYHISELRTNSPKQQNKYYIYSSITWVEQKFHKQISESTMRSYLKLCLKK